MHQTEELLAAARDRDSVGRLIHEGDTKLIESLLDACTALPILAGSTSLLCLVLAMHVRQGASLAVDLAARSGGEQDADRKPDHVPS